MVGVAADDTPWHLSPTSRDDIAARAVALVLGHQLEVARQREPGTLAGDAEDLHQYRVAIRRSRSVLAAARGVVPDDRRARAGQRLTRLARLTSPVRDLDVFIDDLPGVVARADPADNPGADNPGAGTPGVQDLVAVLQRWRGEAAAVLAAEMRGPEGAETMRAWRAASDLHLVGGDPRGSRATEPAGEVAGDMVASAFRRARKVGRAAAESDDLEHWHDLRKALKRLRYLLEAFGPMYDSDELEGLVRPLRKLQNRIGRLQDLRVQDTLLVALAAESDHRGDPVPAATARRLAVLLDAEVDRVHHGCLTAWTAFDTPATSAAARRLTAAG